MNVSGYLAFAPTGTLSGMIFLVFLVAIWLVAYSIVLYKSKNFLKSNAKSTTYTRAYLDAKNVFIEVPVMTPWEGSALSRIEAEKI